MKTEAQKNARKRYDKQCRRLVVTVYPTEPEIMRKVAEVDSYGAYIKGLIMDDIKRSG